MADADTAILVSLVPVIVGVVNVGLVAKTLAPVPVSSVKAAARFADVGVARNVATLVPRPETPVDIGSPVQSASEPVKVSEDWSSCTDVPFNTIG